MTKRTKALFATLLAVGCSAAYAGVTYNRIPSSTFAAADTNCGSQVGNTCWVTDCNATPACTAGGGALQQMLVRNEGGTWTTLDTLSGTAADTGTTANTFVLDSDGDNFTLDPQAGGLTLTRAATGTVTLTSADNDATAALTVDPGGNAALTLGSASDTVSVAATAGLALSNAETLSNGTDGTIFAGRNDSGTVTVTAKDDDATAALTVLPGGAAAMTLGGASTTAVTVTTDSVGDAEVVLPNNSVGKAELGGGMYVQGIFCGDLGNNTTVFTSPVTGYSGGNFYTSGLTANDLDYSLAGTGCAAEDNTTEATADEVMFTQVATKVIGLYCRVNSSGANGVTFHVRANTANITPDVTCTIATGSTECTSYTPSTTDVAANATLDVSAVTTTDLSASDYWCMVQFSLQ